jgi:hypothetical protein
MYINFNYLLTKMKKIALFLFFLWCASAKLLAQNQESIEKIYVKFKNPSQAKTKTFGDRSQYKKTNDGLGKILEKYEVLKFVAAFDKISEKEVDKIYELTIPQNKDIEQVIKDCKKLSDVVYVEKNPVYYITGLPSPNDTRRSEQYALQLTKAYQAFATYTGNTKVLVAILDDGVLLNHEDLAANIYTNNAEIPNNNIDDDNNGYVDDVNGWDAADADNNPNPPANIAGPNQFSHGTHCAGIAAAVTNNAKGVASISYNVLKILPVKSTRNSIPAPYTSVTNSLQGLQYAIAFKQKNPTIPMIVSMSFGANGQNAFSQAFQDLVNTGANLGIIFVAAAGNAGTELISYPCAYDNVICVANTDRMDNRSNSSQHGSWVDISAPGTDILSTVAQDINSPNGTYAFYSGTSMSTPMVASLAGLLLSQNPALNRFQVEDIIKQGADNINNRNIGFEGKLGAGRINALNSMQILRNETELIPSNISDLIVKESESTGCSLEWTAPNINNLGAATSYEMRYSETPITAANFTSALLLVNQPIPSVYGTLESFRVTGLQPSKNYYIALVAKNFKGNSSPISNTVNFTTRPAPITTIQPNTLAYQLNVDISNTQQNTFNVSNTGGIGSNLDYSIALRDEDFGQVIQRLFYDKEQTNADNSIGLTNNGSFIAATRFVVGSNPFLLTHIQNYINNNSSTPNTRIIINIYKDNELSNEEKTPNTAIFLATQTEIINIPAGGRFFNFALKEPISFKANETFWITFTFPAGLVRAQGFDNNNPFAGIFMLSTNNGSSFQDIQTIGGFGIANFKMRAINGVKWVSLAPSNLTNNITANQNMPITLNFDATDLLPGLYNAFIEVRSNDLNNPILTRGLTLEVSGGKPAIAVNQTNLNFNEIKVCLSQTLSILVENKGKQPLTINSLEFDNLNNINSSNLSFSPTLPLIIPALELRTINISVIPSNPSANFTGRVKLINDDTTNPIKTINFSGKANKPVITVNQEELISNYDFGNQWRKDGINIQGATSKTYKPTVSGKYSVSITVNACNTISDNVDFVITDIDEYLVDNSLEVYPIPSADMINLKSNKFCCNEVKYELFNSNGKQFRAGVLDKNNISQIDLSVIPKGMYILKIIYNESQTIFKKIIRL